MFDKKNISFKPLSDKDFPLLTTWLNTPHVHEWYDKDEINTLEEVTKRYSFKLLKEPTDGFIVLYNSTPVGYIQKYYPKDWKLFREATGYAEGTAGIDLFIGNPDYLGQGFGPFMIKAFLTQHIFTDPTITKCIIDPEPDNHRAIRAYEKAGFVYSKTVQVPEEPDKSYLMELDKSI